MECSIMSAALACETLAGIVVELKEHRTFLTLRTINTIYDSF